jgi:hypothetical protein
VPSFTPPPFFDESSEEFSLFNEDEEAELSLECQHKKKECDETILHPSCSSSSVVSSSVDLPVPCGDRHRRRRITFDECINVREIRHVVDLMLEEDGTSTTESPTIAMIVTELKSQLWFQPSDFDAIRRKAYDLIDLVERKGGTVQNFAPSRKPYIRGLESLLHQNAVERHQMHNALLTAVLNEQTHQYSQHGRIMDTVALADCSVQLSQSSLVEAQRVAQLDAKAMKTPMLRKKRSTQ